MKNNIILFVLFIVFTQTARAGFHIDAALKLGNGSVESSDATTIPSTDMTVYGFEGSIAYKFMGVALGLNGDYSIQKQLTEPSEVSGVNSQGSSFLVSPIIGMGIGPIQLFAKLPKALSGEYELEQKNVYGHTTIYQEPDLLALQVRFVNGPISYIGIEYKKLTFTKVSREGTEIELTESEQVKMSSISLLYGFHF